MSERQRVVLAVLIGVAAVVVAVVLAIALHEPVQPVGTWTWAPADGGWRFCPDGWSDLECGA